MSGMPLSAVKFTVKEAEAALELVKYKAEYNVRHFYGHEHRSTGGQ